MKDTEKNDPLTRINKGLQPLVTDGTDASLPAQFVTPDLNHAVFSDKISL